MSMRSVISVALLLLAGAGLVAVFWPGGTGEDVAEARPTAAEGALPADGVVVYYFHGHKRCMTCNKLEALASESIHDSYGELMRDGTVVFEAVNIETDAGRHFISDYELVNKVVVISERRGGEEVGWKRLDQVWEKIADDQEYRAYIVENLEASLERLGVEHG